MVPGQRLAILEPEGLSGRISGLRAEADRAQGRSASAGAASDAYARRLADLEREGALAQLSAAELDQARTQILAPRAGYVLTPDLAGLEGRRLAAELRRDIVAETGPATWKDRASAPIAAGIHASPPAPPLEVLLARRPRRGLPWLGLGEVFNQR